MKKLIIWDFDNTLARRKNGMWSKTMSEITLDKLERTIDPKEFLPFLKTGFPWHTWQEPHAHIKNGDHWWHEMLPLFEMAFEKLSLPKSLALFVREYYTDSLKWELIGSAKEVLAYFNKKNVLQVVLSNHVPELGQIIESLAIKNYFKKVYNSAVTGYEKPHPEVFDIIKRDFPESGEIWIIGDNLIADIEGGKKAGFKTCWFNPEKKVPENAKVIDWTIYELSELIGNDKL